MSGAEDKAPERTLEQEARRSGRWMRAILGVYLALLAASSFASRGARVEPELPADMQLLELAPRTDDDASDASGPANAADVRAADRAKTERVRLAYHDDGPRDARDAYVLLHGSPGGAHDFDALRPRFAETHRVVTPALPGFGASRQGPLPSYSARAHARYVLDLLDALDIDGAHLIGFSMGGAVALEFAGLAPARTRSVTLLAALGVEELELFGQHELNHAVHVGQWAVLRAARVLVPHFGRFDRQPLDLAYARNFADTDQRRMRPLLERLEAPTLVVHGREDFLVPFAAALEHHRIVPQSELVALDANHFLPWTHAHEVGSAIEEFVARADRGVAPSRTSATPERRARAAAPSDPRGAPAFAGPALALIWILLALATLVSEDLTCIGAGLLVAQGRLGLVAASSACFFGIYVGDLLLFLAGRALGRAALARAPVRWVVSEAAVTRASDWFQSKGASVIFLSRLTPGLRLPTYFAAGVLRTRLASFALYFALAGLVWTPALVGLSAWMGSSILERLDVLHDNVWVLIGGLLVALFVWRNLVLPLFTWRGRRLLRGALLRKWHWEYWPPFVFYPPLACYIAGLALRHRGLRGVTAINPAIPTGGFVGESKGDILDGLGGPDHPGIARYQRLSADQSGDERVRAAREFRERHALSLPIVLKPDVGQRGSGVRVIESEQELEDELRALTYDAMLQEFVPGREYGLFWWRRPDDEHGHLFSLTEKRLPHVVGDGRHTFEELILRDERAICMAKVYFDANADRLQDVPAEGETRALVDLGTHCRGAVFGDAEELRTPALEAFVEELSRGFDGFDFGRYDVRVPSAEALRAGKSIRVLELNGLTSEATHIYDARHGVVYAWRTLAVQWRTAFRLAAWRRAQGGRPSSWGDLLAALRRTSRLASRHAKQRTH